MSIDYDVVTSADEGYLHFAKNITANCWQVCKKIIKIYDLGISEQSKKTLSADFLKIKTDADYKTLNTKKCVRATHKPECILDYFHKQTGRFLFLDADCLFTKNPIFPDSDICLTFRIYSEQTVSDFSQNGIVNSGVIFINSASKNKSAIDCFLKNWIHRCDKDPETTDQKALSDLLLDITTDIHPGVELNYNGALISILESECFNDVKCRTGSIFHFKAAFRREEKRKQYLLIFALLKHTRPVFCAYVVFNKMLLALKRKLKPEKYTVRYIDAFRKM